MAGVLAYVAQRFGEARLEDCYRAVLEPYIQERYMVFDTRVTPYETTVERNLYLVLEAMRAHLCGPERDGSLEYRGARRPLRRPLRPVRLRRSLDARRRDRGHRLACPGAVRVRGDAGTARLGLERGWHLLLLRPLLPRAGEAAHGALGPPGPGRRSAALGWRRGRGRAPASSAPGPSTSRSRRSRTRSIDGWATPSPSCR